MNLADIAWAGAYAVAAIGFFALVHEVLFGTSPAALMEPFTTTCHPLTNGQRGAIYRMKILASKRDRSADFRRRESWGECLKAHLRATGRFPTIA